MSGVTQEFCVRWNSHLGSIGAAFPQLLAGQRFVDVTLACEGQQLHCHRLVLAACSTYFEAILAEHPCKHPVIILPREIKLWEIQALVDFMYKGEVNVTQAGLGQLLRCAEQLQIRGLYGSEATINYKKLHQASLENAKDSVATPKSIRHLDSAETDDAATNSTTSTITTSAPPLPVNQQQQATVLKRQNQDVRQRPQINGSNAQQPAKASSAVVLGSHSNAPTEEDSGDETSNNWNAYGDSFEDCNTSTPIGGNKMSASQLSLQQTRLQMQLQQHYLDSNVEDDHNYVAAHDENNDGSFSAGVPCGSGLLGGMDTDLDTSANTSAGLTHNSIDGYTSYKRVRRSEASLAQAAKCVSKGETFQTVSNMFNIPVSTIRFYMARKGILPKRKRGRGASHAGNIIITTNSGKLSTVPANITHPQSQQMSLDSLQLKTGITSTSGSNSPATATATSMSPSFDMAPSADIVPFHLHSDAATFKLNEQKMHMI
ncbi:protein tramtrack, beta isoform [Drosophila ficusphila]|uniref:protein tramtrack, beta isoform n=1 Tax=Drosophila ficusphila TaxID=30025 RepID=UPI0007E5E26C|nr:protein tramtrack, beta isoform [Drosophila ficusphila]XP_017050730.1 protein tramtrack, beta isoform [Drosophila ficusphila]XP_017050731.1 protein tramtrack, beta isoform [Drosophila ficusphila]